MAAVVSQSWSEVRRFGVTAKADASLGISIIVCCHNSSELLPRTLQHLRAQQSDEIPWEIVLVDNASTDDTAKAATEFWTNSFSPAPLRVVTEPELGLSFARRRGVNEAKYEFLCFVDDDNWVAPDWVQHVWNVMTKNPSVGACGGLSQAEFGGLRPPWFDSYAYLYAILPETNIAGDVTVSRTLWGAGLTVRRSALNDLYERFGFESVLVGRRGTQLSSGEDTELCLALRLAGWSLWLEPRLTFRHYLPARRLSWQYLRRLAYGSAFATPAHDGMYFVSKPARHGMLRAARKIRESWPAQVLEAIVPLLKHPILNMRCLMSNREGDPISIRLEFHKGRLMGVLKSFPWYARRQRAVRRCFAASLVPCSSPLERSA